MKYLSVLFTLLFLTSYITGNNIDSENYSNLDIIDIVHYQEAEEFKCEAHSISGEKETFMLEFPEDIDPKKYVGYATVINGKIVEGPNNKQSTFEKKIIVETINFPID